MFRKQKEGVETFKRKQGCWLSFLSISKCCLAVPLCCTSLGQAETSSRGQAETSSLGQAETSLLGQAETSSCGQAETSLGQAETSSLGQAETSLGQAETSSLGQAETSSLGQAETSSLGQAETIACKQDVKAEDYHTHKCSTSPTKVEGLVLSRLADTRPDKCSTPYNPTP